MKTNQGIKKFGALVVEALLTDFAQIVDMEVFKGMDPNTLTEQQKKKALRALSLIKLKRSLKMEGRVVADGRPQRHKYDKSQTYSAICHQDTILMSLLIYAWETFREHTCMRTWRILQW